MWPHHNNPRQRGVTSVWLRSNSSWLAQFPTVHAHLQVLISENNDLSAELNLAQAQLNERLALVQLYNALGGGWQ